MSIYAGLDVSDKTTHICVVDVEGNPLAQRAETIRQLSAPKCTDVDERAVV